LAIDQGGFSTSPFGRAFRLRPRREIGGAELCLKADHADRLLLGLGAALAFYAAKRPNGQF
jgi:hypothetical protein